MSGTATAEDNGTCIYLHLSDSTPVEEEEIQLADGSTGKVLWKDVLVEGTYPMSPGPGGATTDPMTIITDGESNSATKTISMSDLEASLADGAFKYVTIPTKHRDDLLDNTGYVPQPNGLRRVEKRGKTVLQAALGFTEPDIKGKVKRGTIPDVSAGVFFNWLNKSTRKRYRAALKHVALTPTPFMGNLDPFPAVFASDDELNKDMKIEVYEFADGDITSDDNSKAEIVWNEQDGYNWLRSSVEAALRPEPKPDDGRPYTPTPDYYVEDVSSDKALVTEWYKGGRTRWVIPFTKTDGDITVAPSTRWIESKEAMIAASDEVNFSDITAAVISEKIAIKLAEDFDAVAFGLSVEDVTLDNRAHIKNSKTGSEFLAAFSVIDGAIHIEPADRWESVKAPDKKPEPQKAPAKVTVNLSDVPTHSVGSSKRAAAIERRRRMVASTTR